MTVTPESRGEARGPFPEGLMERLAQEMREHGRQPETGPGALWIEGEEGRVDMALEDGMFRVRVAASEQRQVLRLREAVLHLIDHAAEGLTGRMDWVGGPVPGSLPSNIIFAEVEGVTRIGANFLRVAVRSDQMAVFAEGGMHFRLLLPPEGRAPVWPVIDDRGRSIWPKGEDALHAPAYTIVEIDPTAGTMSFDLYEHDGSLATDWAQGVAPGARIGLSGPGGGHFPPGDWILMAGDETALPAIRRILAHSPAGRQGHVFLETGDPGDRVPLEAPRGIRVTWLDRGAGPGLLEAASAVALPGGQDSRFVWFAAERDQARRAKALFRERFGLQAAEGYFSGYWTAPAA
ncbi:siderophore-interacting protein [Mangrovicoccus algicola]|uniref:Siderophore-interacting protein n=1 Tax=Mangrovicoccus algicola TaxID=2771008 RepID=A0A8J7D178_9RHOB|nr:siderophore-interacting protein [Mangrovicoccus algicola]MBE3640453.1 siderophore-interacting protein [Mangrovicoccus algicola]